MAILAAAVLSFAVWFLVVLLGFNEAPANASDTYETYFQQINWWPYPFFFLALAPGLWLTWEPMLRAWSQLAQTGVLVGSGGKPDEVTVQEVCARVDASEAAPSSPHLPSRCSSIWQIGRRTTMCSSVPSGSTDN